MQELDQGDWVYLQSFIKSQIAKQLNELLTTIRQRILITGLVSMDAVKDFPQVKAILKAIRRSLQELQYSFFGP